MYAHITCIHIYIHTHICTYVHERIVEPSIVDRPSEKRTTTSLQGTKSRGSLLYMSVYMYMYMSVYMYMYMSVYMYMYMCPYACTCTCKASYHTFYPLSHPTIPLEIFISRHGAVSYPPGGRRGGRGRLCVCTSRTSFYQWTANCTYFSEPHLKMSWLSTLQ